MRQGRWALCCVPSGTENPENSCEKCQPNDSQVGWSPAANGVSCGVGLTCHDGHCCDYNCDGKVCGDDGCGGVCGECQDSLVCCEGQCDERCDGNDVDWDGCTDGVVSEFQVGGELPYHSLAAGLAPLPNPAGYLGMALGAIGLAAVVVFAAKRRTAISRLAEVERDRFPLVVEEHRQRAAERRAEHDERVELLRARIETERAEWELAQEKERALHKQQWLENQQAAVENCKKRRQAFEARQPKFMLGAFDAAMRNVVAPYPIIGDLATDAFEELTLRFYFPDHGFQFPEYKVHTTKKGVKRQRGVSSQQHAKLVTELFQGTAIRLLLEVFGLYCTPWLSLSPSKATHQNLGNPERRSRLWYR